MTLFPGQAPRSENAESLPFDQESSASGRDVN
jgi:hypothetical protein